MIKHYLSTLLLVAAVATLSATDHTITTVGLEYSPSDLAVQVGDNVTIVATGSHPTRQVSEETWNMNGTTELAGGFGTSSSSFTFEITNTDAIYYVCYVVSSALALNGTFDVYSLSGQQMNSTFLSSLSGTLSTPYTKGVYVAIIRDRKGKLLFSRSFAIN